MKDARTYTLMLQAAAAVAPLPYMDPALTPDVRAKDLAGRLSLEQHVALLFAGALQKNLLPTGNRSVSALFSCTCGPPVIRSSPAFAPN